MSAPALPSRFDPKVIEPKWQAIWSAHGYARPPDHPTGARFSIILPPPNVTGILTMGHMLGGTVQDLLIRYHRMRGFATVWIPGLDHAGLATQVEVRRKLAKDGIALESLPREEIIGHVEEWKREREAYIRRQTEAAGFSVDWSRYRYTMDAISTRATREAFLALYQEGLIYRGERIVNWDPKLRTAISDLEVKHTEEEGTLLFLRYPWADGSPGGLVVATVRPETIFGDVAVAVHPEDDRHRSAIGREVIVPLTGRAVPVIADPGVDPAFGNGALKVTPRHDLLDYEIFRRHPEILLPPSILDAQGRLEGEWVPSELRGMDRDDARTRVTALLDAADLIERQQSFRHSVGRSERSKAVVEPRLSTQWFVRMAPLAPPVIEAVRSGTIRIYPDRWDLTFFRWMEGLQDWCISRQIVWGHPIPVYYCDSCTVEIAAAELPARCAKCGGNRFTPDPDVLDTWFTSWMWPFVSQGWPEVVVEHLEQYPTSVLVTGRDIMFFWVARMMMAGYRFTGRAPFASVYFTGMLRDEEGRRMSKHLGNSPDPLEVVHEHGADAVRFALLFPNPADQDAAFGTGSLESSRNFLTKLWNLTRFALAHLPEGTPSPSEPPTLTSSSSLENRWILSRYAHTVEAFDRAVAAFELTQAAGVLYQFVWHDLADRYVEIVKETLYGHRGAEFQRESRAVLAFILERTLRLLHPLVPHVTEELWHALPHSGESLMVAAGPRATEARPDPQAEVAMEILLESLRVLRSLRAESKLPVEHLPRVWVRPRGVVEAELLEGERDTIVRLVRLASLELLAREAADPTNAATSVIPQGEYFLELPLRSSADRPGLEREREKLGALLAKSEGRLADPGFRQRAPPGVVIELEAKVKELSARLRRIDELLALLPSQGP